MATSTYAPDWTPEQRAAYVEAYKRGIPVELPMPEHGDECDHCNALRDLMREADEDD